MNLFIKRNALRKHQQIQMNNFYLTRGKAFIIFIGIFCSCVYANSKITLEKKYVDLGALETNGKLYSKRLKFKNEGTDSLEIRYAGSSCGCSRIKEMEDKVEPGGTGCIVIEVDPSKATSGVSSQSLFLETNDPENKTLAIKVFYRTRLAEVELFPKKINLQLATAEVKDQQKNIKKCFYILDNWPKRLEILDINTSKYVRTTMDDILHRCEKGSETHILRFDMRLTQDTPTGIFQEWIKLKTNHPEYSEIVIPINGQVQSGIIISPKIIIFNKKNKTILLHFSVDDEEKEIEILKIQTEAPWLKIKKGEIDKSNFIEYSVSLNEKYIEKRQSKFMKSDICVKLNKPEKEERKIKVMYHGF